MVNQLMSKIRNVLIFIDIMIDYKIQLPVYLNCLYACYILVRCLLFLDNSINIFNCEFSTE